MSQWAGGIQPGHVQADLALGADSQTGLEARARVGYGLTDHLSLGAEAYWQRTAGVSDYGALLGVTAKW